MQPRIGPDHIDSGGKRCCIQLEDALSPGETPVMQRADHSPVDPVDQDGTDGRFGKDDGDGNPAISRIGRRTEYEAAGGVSALDPRARFVNDRCEVESGSRSLTAPRHEYVAGTVHGDRGRLVIPFRGLAVQTRPLL